MDRYRFVSTLGSIGEGPTTFDALSACVGRAWASNLFDSYGAYFGRWDVLSPEGEIVRQEWLYNAEGELLGTFYELRL